MPKIDINAVEGNSVPDCSSLIKFGDWASSFLQKRLCRRKSAVSSFDIGLSDGEILLHDDERGMAEHFLERVDITSLPDPGDGEGMAEGVRATPDGTDVGYASQITDENAQSISCEGLTDMRAVGGNEQRCGRVDLSAAIGGAVLVEALKSMFLFEVAP